MTFVMRSPRTCVANNRAEDLKKTEEAIYSYLETILRSYQTHNSLLDDNTRGKVGCTLEESSYSSVQAIEENIWSFTCHRVYASPKHPRQQRTSVL
ncbi:hypothetical protein F2P81_012085 [Scophthalmus maximus]|uniref:Uncharacterized protein n=1 Tax=Scophthalmus maximus TaxID=52904 RepID=A0A6A4SRZ6_SCOMX|nr:hypothetical protein F2P81_012085 [Scophthalmus maximus]